MVLGMIHVGCWGIVFMCYLQVAGCTSHLQCWLDKPCTILLHHHIPVIYRTMLHLARTRSWHTFAGSPNQIATTVVSCVTVVSFVTCTLHKALPNTACCGMTVTSTLLLCNASHCSSSDPAAVMQDCMVMSLHCLRGKQPLCNCCLTFTTPRSQQQQTMLAMFWQL